MAGLLDKLRALGAPWLEGDELDAEQTADAARARLLLSMCFGTAVSGLVMVGVFWMALDVPVLAAITSGGVVFIIGTWPAMRWSRSVTLAANWASFALVFTLAGIIPLTGGLDSPGISWLVLAPIFALVFGSRISGVVWGGIAVLIVGALYLVPDTAAFFDDYAIVSDHDLMKVSSTVLLMGLLTGLFVIFRRYHQELLDVAANYRADASVDSLTNLANRREFEHRLSHRIRQARCDRSSLVVGGIDIDDFKSINDVHGHAAGDAVLAEAADRLQHALPGMDMVARVGGDEFAVLLDGSEDASEIEIGRRLRWCFAKSFETPEGSLDVDCSIGFGVLSDDALRWRDDDEIRDRALELADAAMYESKTTDRECVVERLDS